MAPLYFRPAHFNLPGLNPGMTLRPDRITDRTYRGTISPSRTGKNQPQKDHYTTRYSSDHPYCFVSFPDSPGPLPRNSHHDKNIDIYTYTSYLILSCKN